MALVRGQSLGSCSHTSLNAITTNHSPSPASVPPRPRHDDVSAESQNSFQNVELASYLDGLHVEGIGNLETLDSMTPFGVTLDVDEAHEQPSTSIPKHLVQDPEQARFVSYKDEASGDSKVPFRKWMRTLHRRARHYSDSPLTGSLPRRLLDHASGAVHFRRAHHRKSSSGSSYAYVAATRSASVSLASASIVTRPENSKGRGRLRAHSRTDRSSRASFSAPRMSEDSGSGDIPLLHDPAETIRSLQRRRILEELISTEEGYIGDVRFLMNVYVTILASLPTLPNGLRSSIKRNLAEIIELHEEILGDLHRVVPDSEYSQKDASMPPSTNVARGHRRWRSLDAVPEHRGPAVTLQTVPGLTSEAQIAGDVAKIFSRKMNRFFVYEEYGAKYEMMIKDVASTHRRMPQWDIYQRGLETLALSLGSVKSYGDQSRKSLTVGDLLVKPIQRICKYPLLFSELLKCTPAQDDPNSHMELESALLRLREATTEINRATNDRQVRATLQKTWILQDRLAFSNQRIDATSRIRIRSFGHVELCGVLHVCWQTQQSVEGQYMICLLYQDVLCLATAGKIEQIYAVEACINMTNVKVEETDNGRGLQCHTAPFSWKVVFECNSQLYEVIMTGCSIRERDEWRRRLDRPALESAEKKDSNLYSSMALNIKSLGTVFGKPGTVARRISIHRATTVGPKSPLCQVILKNTCATRDTPAGPINTSINRSQSLLTTTNYRVPVLAPSRGERARLEAHLSDVWSRESLPFPSMTTSRSRSEHLVRSSASTVMRKLSVTSITSTFSKRSNSVASLGKLLSEAETEPGGENRKPTTGQGRESAAELGEEAAGWGSESRVRSLPRILDESEQKSSTSSLSTPAAEVGKDSEEVRKPSMLQSAQGHVQTQDVSSTDPRALRVSSSNASSLRYSRQASTPSRNSEFSSLVSKEAPDRAAKKPRLVQTASSRWGKVGNISKENMVQGIRSFFR